MVNSTISYSANLRKERRRDLTTKVVGQSIIWIFLILMYIPILILIFFSFVPSKNIDFNAVSKLGFSTSLYDQLFHDDEIFVALGNTVIIAIVSSTIATILATCGAIGAFYSKKRFRRTLEGVNQIPVVNAEIVIALSLTVMFVFIQSYIFKTNIFSFWTLLVGHIILQAPFVYLSVKPKLEQMDPNLYEAALDLGCSQHKALMKTTIPEILPGIASGFLLSITLSLDDFIVTAFTRGSGLLSEYKNIETLSTLVQAKIKKGPIPPQMRALTTFVFVLVIGVAIGWTIYQNVMAKKKKH